MHMLQVLWAEAGTPAALRGRGAELNAGAPRRASIASCLPSWHVLAASGLTRSSEATYGSNCPPLCSGLLKKQERLRLA